LIRKYFLSIGFVPSSITREEDEEVLRNSDGVVGIVPIFTFYFEFMCGDRRNDNLY
jgi:hypothetical protein